MRDKLENFIQENRSSFDDRKPRPGLWDRIEEGMDAPPPRLDTAPRIGLPRWMGMAASVVLLIGLGIVIGLQIADTEPSSPLADEAVELLDEDVERYYKGQVNRRLKRLVNHEYANEVQRDLNEMDVFLKQLKNEFEKAPPDRRKALVFAMIENYKSRIEILERVLDRIESNSISTQKKSDDNEDLNI
ncbi:MAG: anti-sigma factor [Bacteroidota bacterium]